VNHLKDTVYVPLQAVRTEKGKSYCHVVKGGASEEREIVTGDFNEEFIAVEEGLSAGDLVMIRPPSREETEEDETLIEPEPVEETPKQQASAQ
jgi:HlyD family secretion protein